MPEPKTQAERLAAELETKVFHAAVDVLADRLFECGEPRLILEVLDSDRIIHGIESALVEVLYWITDDVDSGEENLMDHDWRRWIEIAQRVGCTPGFISRLKEFERERISRVESEERAAREMHMQRKAGWLS